MFDEPLLHLRKRSRGFTIIELLAILLIVMILVALILPAVSSSREQARSAECLEKLRQLGIGLASYESAHRCFPPSFVRQEDGNPPPPKIPFAHLRYRTHWTGFHLLLPHLELQNLHQKIDFRETWLSPLDNPEDRDIWLVNQTYLPSLICPSANHAFKYLGGDSNIHWMAGSPTDYAFCHGADRIPALKGDDVGCAGGILNYWQNWPKNSRGVFGYNSFCRSQDLRDGKSTTIMMGEKGGGLLTFGGHRDYVPRMKVEYPWGMAAVAYFAPVGNEGEENSAWVVGPYAVTHDFKWPNCPDGVVGSDIPYPINPLPRILPESTDERPFYSFQSAHPSGANFLMSDGSVRFLSETIDQPILEALSTIAGGEVPDQDF